MTDLTAILQFASALNTPLLSYTCWLVWRIYNNHLPHIEKRIDALAERISRLEGLQAGIEQELRRGR